MRSVLVIIPGLHGWALDRLYAPLAHLDGVRVDYVNGNLIDARDVEFVHAAYFGNVTNCDVPRNKWVVSIHHLEAHNRERIPKAMHGAAMTTAPYPEAFVTLARGGCRVKFVPYWVEPQTPSTSRPEVLGLLGMRWATKRHEVIKAAAALAGVPVVDWTRDPADLTPATRPLDEFYGQVGVYVNGSYCDAGPMPALDALARGIPVVTTPDGSVPMYLREGVHGTYTDGTVEDMARAIDRALHLPQFEPPNMPTLDDWLARHAEIYDACQA